MRKNSFLVNSIISYFPVKWEVFLLIFFKRQSWNFSFFELSLPDDEPVYTLKKVMEELDFSGLLANCSDKGRTGYNPIMMYAVVTYANMRGIRAVDRIVELCERDLAFIWLTKGQKPIRTNLITLP